MNNLFSGSWVKDPGSPGSSIQMTRSSSGTIGSAAAAGGANLNKFFDDVESIKDELKEIERAHRSLHESNEALKTLHSTAAVRDIRTRMDSDVALALKKAKVIKLRLESLDRSNAANRSAPGDQMEAFGELRRRAAAEHREAVARRYYAVTGEEADEAAVEAMAAAEEKGEGMLRAAVVGGRGAVEAAVAEMKERRGAAEELERSLVELHQVFLDMAVMVEAQGHQIDDIESQVEERDLSSIVERSSFKRRSGIREIRGSGLVLGLFCCLLLCSSLFFRLCSRNDGGLGLAHHRPLSPAEKEVI
ncbi:hypothetical protein KFK09_002694 [Dendrobium nobile]|uniref:t-SNARE coiled-coil homology domain-containing protein n=1 Tax=Dendrobium nobile TaxID=94219 RepID=A0A8T3C7U9_DENNO|nr:hypothetical protein KFK09_002694 [Dendrobium nobile]